MSMRNFKKLTIIGVVLLSILITVGFIKQYIRSGLRQLVTTYVIDVTLDEPARQIIGKQKTTYVNTYDKELKTVYFYIYPNAFKAPDTAPVLPEDWESAYPNGFSPGFIQIHDITIDGEAVMYDIKREQQIILKIDLPDAIDLYEKVEIRMKYTVQLPPCIGRFGYGDNTINAANSYPITAVYDKEGWHIYPYSSIGDPFYSAVANYEVIIRTPKTYTIAHTGKLIEKKSQNDLYVHKINAKKVRDFAWFASERYEKAEKIVDDVAIKSYSFSGYGDRVLEIASNALKTFNDLFGRYPYPTLSIAESDFYVGGMEYPGIIQLDAQAYINALSHQNSETQRYNIHELWLEYLVVHEIAHQWWYAVVGNNQVKEPWLDEALTEYATLLYFEKNKGEEYRNMMMETFILSNIHAYGGHPFMKQVVSRPIDTFESWEEYASLVYAQGALLHHELRNYMGDAYYFKLLKEYYKKYQFRQATIEDFIKLADEISPKDTRVIFEGRLQMR